MIDPMRWWDIDEAVAIDRDLFGATAWSAATFWSELAGVPASRVYLASRDDTGLTGYGGIQVVGSDADIQTLAVRPDRQRRGIGAELLLALIQEARDRDVAALHLEVRADNVGAQALYAAHGFEQLAVRRNYYPDRSDALAQRLLLRSAARLGMGLPSGGVSRGG